MKKVGIPMCLVNFKKIFIFVITVCFLISLTGCGLEPAERAEQPHLYWKDIEVVVESVSKKHWFATVHRYELSVTVYSEEYDLQKTLDFYSSGMFAPEYWNLEKGDVVTAELYSWVMDSTGEVVRRSINQLK